MKITVSDDEDEEAGAAASVDTDALPIVGSWAAAHEAECAAALPILGSWGAASQVSVGVHADPARAFPRVAARAVVQRPLLIPVDAAGFPKQAFDHSSNCVMDEDLRLVLQRISVGLQPADLCPRSSQLLLHDLGRQNASL